MSKRLRPQVVLYGLIAAVLIGAVFGSAITWAVMTFSVEAAVLPADEPKSEPVACKPTETLDEVFMETEEEPTSEPTEEEEPAATALDEEPLQAHRVGTCEITAYCNCVTCCGIWSEDHPSRVGTGYVQKTASGTIPTAGRTVAVDTSVIPMGAVVWINGVSYIAEDTGAAVKGKVVDVFFDDHEAARQFGRQTAEVYYVY